jgi:branched-chain amino acid transport system ATP-binding protein
MSPPGRPKGEFPRAQPEGSMSPPGRPKGEFPRAQPEGSMSPSGRPKGEFPRAQPEGSGSNVLLQLRDVHAYYGKSHVLDGVSLSIGTGEIVSLLGRNGSGRSTTVKTVMGLTDAHGTLRWRGESVLGLRPFEIARRGIAYVPESRDVFPRLTVHQNLLLGEQKARRGEPRWPIADLYALFPRLKERQHVEAGVLSGGEQQMLTLCRALRGEPELLMVDEPTEGLAPQIVEQVAQLLLEFQRRGGAVLLVEQKLTIALQVSQRCLVMGRGRVVFEGTPAQLRADAPLRREWLEV